MKNLIYALLLIFLSSFSIAHANTQIPTNEVSTNCTTWTKNLSCADKTQDLVNNVVDQLSGGSGSPGGSNTEIQYNNNGNFAGGLMYYVNGNVGIGSLSPGQALDVNGTIRTTGFQLNLSPLANGNVLVSNNLGIGTWMPPSTIGVSGSSSNWLNSGSDVTLAGGNVGIGTTKTTTSALTVMNGNVGIGTWTPTSLLTLQSTSSNEQSSLGSELTSSSGWTSTNWTGSYGAGFTHTAGNTSALSQTITISAGNIYVVSILISGCNAGSTGTLTVSLGGYTSVVSGGDWAFNDCTATQPATYYYAPLATSTASIVFTPSSAFNGTLSNISVKQLTGSSTPVFAIKGSDNLKMLEERFTPDSKGGQSIFIGRYTGGDLSGGGYSNGVGYATLNNLSSGFNNNGFGYNSQYSTTTGAYNNSFGYQSLYNNISGYDNSAFGDVSLTANTIGYGNSAFGNAVMINNTQGNSNTAFGNHALASNVTGNSNVVLGNRAGYNETGSNYFYVGNIQQASELNDQRYSLMSGTFAGAAGTTANQYLSINGNLGLGTYQPSHSITIDNFAGAADGKIALNSNITSFDASNWGGSMIYSSSNGGSTYPFTGQGNLILQSRPQSARDIDFVTSSSDLVRMTITSGGNVGIGTWLPLGTFVVTTGNVGIGSNAPGSTLDVNGTLNGMRFYGNIGIGTYGTPLPTTGGLITIGGLCSRAVGPVGTCWTSTGVLGYCNGAGNICTTCTACTN